MAHIEFKERINDLTEEVWRFYAYDNYIVLDFYAYCTRKTKRHSFKAEKTYSRLSHRTSNMLESDVRLTYEIRTLALDKFVSSINVVKQSEIKR